MSKSNYWDRSFLGIKYYKVQYYVKLLLYKSLGITLPKMMDQRNYWDIRGHAFMDDMMKSGFDDREIFFQNMLIHELKKLEFNSFFEAGSGYGWNIRRVYEEFPHACVGGLDFSITQLMNSKKYLENTEIPVVNGDNCMIPLKDNAYDIGFSLGVFMNIHPSKIKSALKEMIRVCGKYIIHIEYDENYTTPELKKQRAFKTNIISHNYKKLYTDLGVNVEKFSTYKEFGKYYDEHINNISTRLTRWEGFEGAEKYIFIMVKL